MSFTVTSQHDSGVVRMTLVGRLDANTAPTFKTEIDSESSDPIM